jgi:hypothetical protein
VTDKGGDRNKDGRSKADDRNKTLTNGADQVIHQVQKGLHWQKGPFKNKDGTDSGDSLHGGTKEVENKALTGGLVVKTRLAYPDVQNKTKVEDGKNEDRTKEGENKAKVAPETLTKKITKDPVKKLTKNHAKKLAKDHNRPVDKTLLAFNHSGRKNKERIGTDKTSFGGLGKPMFGGLKVNTRLANLLAKDLNKGGIKDTTEKLAKDLAEVDARTLTRKLAKDHTKRFARTLAKKLAKDLNRLESKNRLGFTHTDSKNKTEAKSGKSKDRTEDGENEYHTKKKLA